MNPEISTGVRSRITIKVKTSRLFQILTGFPFVFSVLFSFSFNALISRRTFTYGPYIYTIIYEYVTFKSSYRQYNVRC